MNAKSHFSAATGLLAGALLALVPASAADTTKDTDAFPVFDNYVKISGAANELTGSRAAFQARTQKASKGSAGIEDMFYSYDLSKELNLIVDGKALPGQEDYLLHFLFTKNEVGTFEAGYKQFRTFYDGAGGFFPLNNVWLPLYKRALFVDRGKFFVNATLAQPKSPVYTFKYSNETRDGRKDSTIWGDTDFSGVPIFSQSALNPISANRKIIPAYLDLDERQEHWEVSMRETVGNSTGVFTVSADRITNLDTRSVDRYPGELKPFPAIPSTPPTLVPPALANNQNKGYDQQNFKERSINVAGRIETAFNDKITGFIGGNYHSANIDIAASRLIQGYLATAIGTVTPVGSFTSGGRPPYSYTSAGKLKQKIWTGNIGVETKLIPDLRVDLAVKLEDSRVTGDNLATYINNLVVPATGAVTPQLVAAPNHSSISEKPWTPQVDVRYTGIKNVVLFAFWDHRNLTQDERKSYTGISPSGAVILQALSISTENVSEKHSNLKVGANWKVSPALAFRAEFFSKDHENNFTGYGGSAGSYYILDYDTYGGRFSMTYHPTPQLGFTTRYVVQRGHGTVSEDGFLEGDSNDSRRYEIAETIDWNPNKVVYLQLNANLAYDRTSTAYPRAGGSANDVLHNADNNYWDGSFITGFVLDKNTDANVRATYYRADNYNPALAAATDPYGQGVRDYSVTVGLKHKFTDRLIGEGRIGYLNSNNETTGGFANYKGAIGYLSFTYRL